MTGPRLYHRHGLVIAVATDGTAAACGETERQALRRLREAPVLTLRSDEDWIQAVLRARREARGRR